MDEITLIDEIDVKALKKQRDTILNIVMCPDKHKLTDAQVRNIDPVIAILDAILDIREEKKMESDKKKIENTKNLISNLEFDKLGDLTYKRKGEFVMLYLIDKFVGYSKIMTDCESQEYVTLNHQLIYLNTISKKK